jgi:hypothetical protein
MEQVSESTSEEATADLNCKGDALGAGRALQRLQRTMRGHE